MEQENFANPAEPGQGDGITRRDFLDKSGRLATVATIGSLFSPFILTSKAAAAKTLSFWQFYAPGRGGSHTEQMVRGLRQGLERDA
jgi:hypothetical protein